MHIYIEIFLLNLSPYLAVFINLHFYLPIFCLWVVLCLHLELNMKNAYTLRFVFQAKNPRELLQSISYPFILCISLP